MDHLSLCAGVMVREHNVAYSVLHCMVNFKYKLNQEYRCCHRRLRRH